MTYRRDISQAETCSRPEFGDSRNVDMSKLLEYYKSIQKEVKSYELWVGVGVGVFLPQGHEGAKFTQRISAVNMPSLTPTLGHSLSSSIPRRWNSII